VVLANAGGVPFEQLPFQCFQEARKVLAKDRAEKIEKIEKERARIARLRDVPDEEAGGTRQKEHRLRSMQKTLEEWKIYADINDPAVKKRFEDGFGRLHESYTKA
jgi:large subunit ribosomal protein L35